MRIVFEEAPLLDKVAMMQAWCMAWTTHPSHEAIKSGYVDDWFDECEKRVEKVLARRKKDNR